jgi:hypothetical protein
MDGTGSSVDVSGPGGYLRRMTFRWPRLKAAVALLLLAMVAAPVLQASVAAADAHACCPEGAPAADSSKPCQYVAPLGCCSLVAVPATPTSDDPRPQPLLLALVTPLSLPPEPFEPARAALRDGHDLPRTLILRTTVLRL